MAAFKLDQLDPCVALAQDLKSFEAKVTKAGSELPQQKRVYWLSERFDDGDQRCPGP